MCSVCVVFIFMCAISYLQFFLLPHNLSYLNTACNWFEICVCVNSVVQVKVMYVKMVRLCASNCGDMVVVDIMLLVIVL